MKTTTTTTAEEEKEEAKYHLSFYFHSIIERRARPGVCQQKSVGVDEKSRTDASLSKLSSSFAQRLLKLKRENSPNERTISHQSGRKRR